MIDLLREHAVPISIILTSGAVMLAVAILYFQDRRMTDLYQEIKRDISSQKGLNTWYQQKLQVLHRYLASENHEPIDFSVSPEGKAEDYDDFDVMRENWIIQLDRPLAEKLYNFCDETGYKVKDFTQEAIRNHLENQGKIEKPSDFSEKLYEKLSDIESKLDDDTVTRTRDAIKETIENQQLSEDIQGEQSPSDESSEDIEAVHETVSEHVDIPGEPEDYTEDDIEDETDDNSDKEFGSRDDKPNNEEETLNHLEFENFDPSTPELSDPVPEITVPPPYSDYAVSLKCEIFSRRSGYWNQVARKSPSVNLKPHKDVKDYTVNKLEFWYEMFVGPLPRELCVRHSTEYAPREINNLSHLAIQARPNRASAQCKSRKRLPLQCIKGTQHIAPIKILQHIPIKINDYKSLDLPVSSDHELEEYLIECADRNQREITTPENASENFRPLEDEESKVDVEHSDTGFGLDEEVG